MQANKQQMDEQNMFERINRKDETAFALLLDQYMPMIRQETARFRHYAIEEDDLAQEATLGLLSAAKSFREDGGASFATFARVCVRRRLINIFRTIPQAEIPHESPLDAGEREELEFPPSPDQWIQEKEEEVELLQKLRHILSVTEYRVLILHMASYSYNEIAQMLQMSVKSVDNAVQRIRQKLKKAL